MHKRRNIILFSKALSTDLKGYENKQLKLVGCPPNGSSSTYIVRIVQSDWTSVVDDSGNGACFTLESNYKYLYIQIGLDVTFNNVVFKPMITPDLNATYDDFEPYKEQTVTLPYTLNAIPVESGGNVTVNGQQYIADYVDIENKKIVRMVGKTVFNEETDWVKNTTGEYYTMLDYSKYQKESIGFCDILSSSLYDRKNSFFINQHGAIRVNITTEEDTTSTIQSIMNGHYLYGILATPIITDLTDAEVQAFKDLYTYTPITTVSASSGQLTPYIEFGLS